MDTAKVVGKPAFASFIERQAEEVSVVAPVARAAGEFSYGEVQDASSLEEEEYIPTLSSPKKYLLPPQEALFRFSSPADSAVHEGEELEYTADVEQKRRILLAVRPCDIAAIHRMDQVFSDTEPDPHYLARRRAAIIIGLDCLEPCDELAFCAAVGTSDADEGFDLLLTDLGEDWLVRVGTDQGAELLEECQEIRDATEQDLQRLKDVVQAKEKVFRKCQERLDFPGEDIPEVLEGSEDSPVWDEYGDRCLGCGRCNLVCPTCFCFDVEDTVSLDLKEGERTRRWDGCTLLEFAAVAGGENFRRERSDRLRHMFLHKGKYGPERYGDLYCIGCGRCARTCLAGIDHPEVYNALMRHRDKGDDHG